MAREMVVQALLSFLLVLVAAGQIPAAQKTPPPFTRPMPDELKRGQALFRAHCATCHGVDARDTDKGPTFLQKTYTPYLHADIAFQLAVERGVRAHHFRFGDMPRIQHVSREDLRAIVEYVRWLQREAGIY